MNKLLKKQWNLNGQIEMFNSFLNSIDQQIVYRWPSQDQAATLLIRMRHSHEIGLVTKRSSLFFFFFSDLFLDSLPIPKYVGENLDDLE